MVRVVRSDLPALRPTAKSFCRGQLCNIQPQRDNNPHRRAQTRKARTGIHEYASAGLFCLSAKGIFEACRGFEPRRTLRQSIPILPLQISPSGLRIFRALSQVSQQLRRPSRWLSLRQPGPQVRSFAPP